MGLSLKTKEASSSLFADSAAAAERKERKSAPRAEKQSSAKASSNSPSNTKAKNLFQVELERFAARQKEEAADAAKKETKE